MQRDLFHITTGPSPFETRVPFLERYRLNLRLDHLLILMIGFVMLYAFVYSAGVERGKKHVTREINAATAKLQQQLFDKTDGKSVVTVDAAKLPPAEAAPAETAVQVEPTRAEPEPLEQKPVETAAVEAAKPEGKYTIQLVTYDSESLAQRQLKALSEKGYRGFVVPKGKYLQVCVNAFDSRKGAASLLQELKLQGMAPKDAYIRNMPK